MVKSVEQPFPSSSTTAYQGLGATIWSQFFLRVASSAGVLVIGSYFADLQAKGVAITSLLIGIVTALAYLAELFFAPFAGSLSDVRGRKLFLLAGPLLAAVAVLLQPLASLGATLPLLGLVLTLIGASKFIEGVGSAAAVPATLGFLAESTDHHPGRRGRQMSFYELASSGGIAFGAVVGPLLWVYLHLWAFVALSLLYLIAAGLIMLFVREKREAANDREPQSSSIFDLRRYVVILSNQHLLLFIPAWIAVNAILGVWITAQITFVLTGNFHVTGQLFVGSLRGHEGLLSLYLGGYVLVFSICVVAWAFLLGRLPKLPVMLVTILGSALASIGLGAINHGGAPLLFVPLVLLGVFLEAGFTPAALAYLANMSESFAADRGLLMGLYSVVLGAGYFLGNFLSSVFAQIAYFDGMALLTIILVIIGMLSVALLMLVQKRSGHNERTATIITDV